MGAAIEVVSSCCGKKRHLECKHCEVQGLPVLAEESEAGGELCTSLVFETDDPIEARSAVSKPIVEHESPRSSAHDIENPPDSSSHVASHASAKRLKNQPHMQIAEAQVLQSRLIIENGTAGRSCSSASIVSQEQPQCVDSQAAVKLLASKSQDDKDEQPHEDTIVRLEGSAASDAISKALDAGGPCWPLVAVKSRLEGCGGAVFVDSATNLGAACYVGRGLQFGRFEAAVGTAAERGATAVAVIQRAVEAAIDGGRARSRRHVFWYLERGLISSVREVLKNNVKARVELFESPNKMGMFILASSTQLGMEPILPASCFLRRLRIDDAEQVNSESGPGPNTMEEAGVGCWGVEVSGTLKGWAVRGADGAIGMLYVSKEWRRRGLATAILYQICKDLRSIGFPCFTYIRDDNTPSRKAFFRIGFQRVIDVKWCCLNVL